MMFGWQREAFAAMHAALKPGGVLGVVEHRGDPRRAQDPKAASGYVHEQYAIELIESVGFKLVGALRGQREPEGHEGLRERRVDAAADVRGRRRGSRALCRDR